MPNSQRKRKCANDACLRCLNRHSKFREPHLCTRECYWCKQRHVNAFAHYGHMCPHVDSGPDRKLWANLEKFRGTEAPDYVPPGIATLAVPTIDFGTAPQACQGCEGKEAEKKTLSEGKAALMEKVTLLTKKLLLKERELEEDVAKETKALGEDAGFLQQQVEFLTTSQEKSTYELAEMERKMEDKTRLAYLAGYKKARQEMGYED